MKIGCRAGLHPSTARGALSEVEGQACPVRADLKVRTTYRLFDPGRRRFVLKFVEEPRAIEREFDTWQEFLAYKLLAIAESGPEDDELVEVCDVIGFEHTRELLAVLGEMKTLADDAIERRSEQFIRNCREPRA